MHDNCMVRKKTKIVGQAFGWPPTKTATERSLELVVISVLYLQQGTRCIFLQFCAKIFNSYLLTPGYLYSCVLVYLQTVILSAPVRPVAY